MYYNVYYIFMYTLWFYNAIMLSHMFMMQVTSNAINNKFK